MWTWLRPNNPLYNRLMRPHHKLVVGDGIRPNFIVGFLLGISFNCCVIQGIATDLYSSQIYLAISLLLTLLAPIAHGTYTAYITAMDCSDSQFELITLTSLSNQKIVNGYWRYTLKRSQLAIGLGFGFVLFLMAAVTFFILSNEILYTSPQTNISDESEIIINFAATSFLISIGYVGMYFMAGLIGIATALATRHRNTSWLASIMINSILLIIWFLIANSLLRPLIDDLRIVSLHANLILVSVAPLILMLVVVKLAHYFTRNPISTFILLASNRRNLTL